TRSRGNAACPPERQSEIPHRQLVQVHAQPRETQRKHRDRLCPRGGRGYGYAQLPRREEDVLGPEERADTRPSGHCLTAASFRHIARMEPLLCSALAPKLPCFDRSISWASW